MPFLCCGNYRIMVVAWSINHSYLIREFFLPFFSLKAISYPCIASGSGLLERTQFRRSSFYTVLTQYASVVSIGDPTRNRYQHISLDISGHGSRSR